MWIKEIYVKILAPFAPHLAEEIWSLLKRKNSIFDEEWPSYDENKTIKNNIKIAVQVNGKVRCTIDIKLNDEKDSILAMAKENLNVQSYLSNKKIIKEIYIPGKIINFVVN